MKCYYDANETLQIRNVEGVLVTLEQGDIVDIPKIPGDKVKELFPYEEPVKKPIAPAPKKKKKETSARKSSKK